MDTVFPRETRPVEFGGLTEKFPKSVEFPGGSSFPENDTDSEIGERSSFWHFIFRKISKIYLQRLKKYVFPRFLFFFLALRAKYFRNGLFLVLNVLNWSFLEGSSFLGGSGFLVGRVSRKTTAI